MGELTLVLYNGEHKTADLSYAASCVDGEVGVFGFELPFISVFFKWDLSKDDVKEVYIKDVEEGELDFLNLNDLVNVDTLEFENVVGLKRIVCRTTRTKKLNIPDPNSIERIRCNYFTKIVNYDELDKGRMELSFE